MLAWHTGIHNGTRAPARDAYIHRPKCCRPCIVGQFESHHLARDIRARQLVLLQHYSFGLVCTGQDTRLYLYTTVVSSVRCGGGLRIALSDSQYSFVLLFSLVINVDGLMSWPPLVTYI